jgi:hypothetical protein
VIAASVAFSGARIALNAAAGAAIGAGQATLSSVASSGTALDRKAVLTGTVLGAVSAGAGSAAGEIVEGSMKAAAGRLVSAPANASAATKSLAETLNRDTLSAATPAQVETAKAGPVVGNSLGQAAGSALDAHFHSTNPNLIQQVAVAAIVPVIVVKSGRIHGFGFRASNLVCLDARVFRHWCS